MDLVRRASRMIPAASPFQLPTNDNHKRRGGANQRQVHPTIAFLRKPLRLRGNSAVSVPLGVVLLFPVIVIILVFTLFARHPNVPANVQPGGSAPEIRYASPYCEYQLFAANLATGKSMKSTTRSSLKAAAYPTRRRPVRMPPLSFSPETRRLTASSSR